MASAKFLEEALSTDVDESAVSAIVGSLETQLVTTATTQPTLGVAHQQSPTSAQQNHQSNGSPAAAAATVVVPAVAATAAATTTTASPQAPKQQQQQQHVANGTNGSSSNGNGPSSGPQAPMVNNMTTAAAQELAKATLTPTSSSAQVALAAVNVVTSSSAQQQSSQTPVQVQSVQPSSQSQHQQSSQTQTPIQVPNQVMQQQQTTQQQQTNFINQVTSNQVTSNQTNQLTALAKVQGEHVKIVYPGSGQVIATTGVVNANNKLTFPAQNVAQLANGALGVVTTQTVLQSTSNAVSNVTGTQTTNPATINVNKQTALVIKSSVAPGGMVSVPMSVPVTVAANMTNTAQQGKTGVTSAIVPSNVQILNVNTMRPGTPVTGQQAGKQVASRVVIGQHMMGGRAGTPGITLQALQGLQAGTQGHLLLKTENGQFQLLRVGPAPTPGTPAGTVTPNNIAANAVVASPSATGTTYRLASLPATVAPTVTTTTVTPVTSTIVATTTTAPTPAATIGQVGVQTPAQRQAADNTKEKCRKFLANLLELSSREPKHVERNVRTLIQELIDIKVEPEEFCVRLEKLLNASPQPCLIGFLRKSLPLLRQALITSEVVIEGIRPPPSNVVFSYGSATPVLTQRMKPVVAVAPATTVATPAPTQVVGSSTTIAVTPAAATQVRVMAPLTGVTNVPRPPQPMVQQRLVRPVTTVVRPPMTTYSVKTATVPAASLQQQHPSHLQQQQQQHQHHQQQHQQQHQQHQHQHQQQQHLPITTSVLSNTSTSTIRQSTMPIVVQKSQPMTTAAKTMVVSTQNKTISTTTLPNKTTVPSVQPKPTPKEKEKKTFSSAGYTGDDDINDVAAMGGVNLAEESQRILGSTKFVGTQIRSCKDEIFLHMTPLQQKINKIVTSYGLEEPNQDVASLISHAAQERLKNLVEKLAIIAEHRIDLVKVDPRYEVTQDVRAQLKFLEELDRVERKRHDEQEREVLLKAAKSRAKTEDPEQAKLKAKAKEMQRVEMEEARQREANQTALQAIGPRKKPRLDLGSSSTNSPSSNIGLSSSGGLNRQLPLRPRLKRVNFRDLLFLLEQEKETCRSATLYKSYLK